MKPPEDDEIQIGNNVLLEPLMNDVWRSLHTICFVIPTPTDLR
jgi:hypothetical protein